MLDLGADYGSVNEKTGGNASLKKEFPGEINVSTSASANDGGSDGESAQSYTLRLTKKILGGGSFGTVIANIREIILNTFIYTIRRR